MTDDVNSVSTLNALPAHAATFDWATSVEVYIRPWSDGSYWVSVLLTEPHTRRFHFVNMVTNRTFLRGSREVRKFKTLSSAHAFASEIYWRLGLDDRFGHIVPKIALFPLPNDGDDDE